MSTNCIIGVDTGNRCIKTASQIFVAGLKSFTREPVVKQDMIKYKDKYYMLSKERVSYLQDKTETEDYFILALFGIAKELQERGINTEITIPVSLGLGLPPSHLNRLKGRFKEYFNRGVVSFEYNNRRITIDIKDIYVFPQGFAAIFDNFNDIRNFSKAYIVDIGGYTTDIILLNYGQGDPAFCESINYGLIPLYNKIAWGIQAKYGVYPDENQIDEMIKCNKEIITDMPMLAIVNEVAEKYIADLLRKLSEFGVDLRLSKGIFIGGGSERFKNMIKNSDFVNEPYFISNIHANALGYEAFVKAWT